MATKSTTRIQQNVDFLKDAPSEAPLLNAGVLTLDTENAKHFDVLLSGGGVTSFVFTSLPEIGHTKEITIKFTQDNVGFNTISWNTTGPGNFYMPVGVEGIWPTFPSDFAGEIDIVKILMAYEPITNILNYYIYIIAQRFQLEVPPEGQF